MLVVLTLMGVAGALVAPVLRPRSAGAERAEASIVIAARQSAIRRAEPLRLRMQANGSWSLAVQRDGALVDSGRVSGQLPAVDLLLDALGGCVPVAQPAVRDFDPLACAFAGEASPQ